MADEKWSEQPLDPQPNSSDKSLKIDAGDNESKQYELGALIPNVKIFETGRKYFKGDIIRFFDAENFICVADEATLSTFIPTEWRPLRADLTTSLVEGGVQNIHTGIEIREVSAIKGTIDSVITQIPLHFQVNDLFIISGDTIFDANFQLNGKFAKVTAVITASKVEFDYTDGSPIPPSGSAVQGTVQNLTRFNVSEIKGFIVDNTDTANPVATPVSKAATPGQQTDFNAQTQVLFLTSAAAFAFTSSADEKAEDSITSLRIAILANAIPFGAFGNLMVFLQNSPDSIYQKTISDLLVKRALGGLMVKEGIISQGSNGLEVDMSGGEFFYPNAGYPQEPSITDVKSNSFIDFDDSNTSPFTPPNLAIAFINGNGSDDTSNTGGTEIDPTKYNPLTGSPPFTLQDVPDGEFQIFRVYASNSVMVIHHATETWKSLDTARDSLDLGDFTRRDNTLPLSFRGYVIVKKELTAWSGGVDGQDFLFVAKPPGADYDNGVPQNRGAIVTFDQLQSMLALESTGSVGGGLVSLAQLQSITSLVVLADMSATILTDNTQGWVQGDKIKLTGFLPTTLNGEFEIVAITENVEIDFVHTVQDVTASQLGTVQNLRRISITPGNGQIAKQEGVNDNSVAPVSWNAESDLSFSDADMDKALIVVTKDIDGLTDTIASDTSPLTAEFLRDNILLAILKTRQGLSTDVDARTFFSIQNQRISLVALRSQINDFRETKFFFSSGAALLEATPATDYKLRRNAGLIVGNGINFDNSTESPNVRQVPAVVAPDFVQFTLVKESGFIALNVENIEDIDTTLFDDDGTLTAVPLRSNQNTLSFQVLRAIYEPETDQILMQYGTQLYSELEIAAGAYATETPDFPPGLSDVAFVAYSLIVTNVSGDNWDINDEQAIFFGDITAGSAAAGVANLFLLLSNLSIDVDKDWNDKNMSNINTLAINNFVTINRSTTPFPVPPTTTGRIGVQEGTDGVDHLVFKSISNTDVLDKPDFSIFQSYAGQISVINMPFYFGISGSGHNSGTNLIDAEIIFDRPTTIIKMSVRLWSPTDTSSSGTIIITLKKNDVATALTFTIPFPTDLSPPQNFIATADVDFVEGDRVTYEATGTNTVDIKVTASTITGHETI